MNGDGLTARQILALRLGIGFIQGQALYLFASTHPGSWPATQPLQHAALFHAFAFTPVLLLLGIGTMRLPRLATWFGIATLVTAGLGAYGKWRIIGGNSWDTSIALDIFLVPGLFIAHALIAGGDIDRRFRATYATHFDVAWKMALQIALATVFAGAFWLLLWLGALLFELLGLSFLRTLIAHDWFAYPVTTLVVAGGIHLTDVQSGLVRGMRTLVLALFSWLLPLITVLVAGFLVALPFTGLAPLWRISHASGELLAAAAILIILINAMYQDGDTERTAPAPLRYAGMAAAVALIPLVLLAAYALGLRVGQYGWTQERVATAACILIAGFYAAGYAFSVMRPVPLKLIENWNFAASLLSLTVLLCLFSPVADPARIAVNSQLARLTDGAVMPAQFDFAYLQTHGLRFGKSALEQLAKSTNPQVHRGAADMLASRLAGSLVARDGHLRKPQEIAAGLTIHPAGAKLPPSFIAQDWNYADVIGGAMRCLSPQNRQQSDCEAVVADLDGDGHPEVTMVTDASPRMNDRFEIFQADIFARQESGRWHRIATFGYPHCPGDLAAIRAGHLKYRPMNRPDIQIGDRPAPLIWTKDRPDPCPVNHAR